MSTITIEREDDWYVITDEETGVTTQGESKFEALLMLADALAAHREDDVDLPGLAADVFRPTYDVGFGTNFDPEAESRLADRSLPEDQEALLEAVAELAPAERRSLTPMVVPPVPAEEIETIEDDRLRAHAWDLDALATAFNHTTDVITVDHARDPPDTWVTEEERAYLEFASFLIGRTFEHISERVGEELETASGEG